MHEQAQQNAANAAEIAKLKSDAAKAKVDTLVAEGVAAGKIKPAQLAWAKTLSTKDLKAFLEATPALFSPRQAAPGVDESASEDTDSDGLTATERQICQMSGVSAESYKKQRDLNAPKLPKGN
jgi:phage I-like protein